MGLRNNKLKIIGSGYAINHFTYVDNVVYSILCCINKKKPLPKQQQNITNNEDNNNNNNNGSSIYFITNEDSIDLYKMIQYICKELQLQNINKKVPIWLAYNVAYILEIIGYIQLLLFRINKKPLLTRYVVNIFSSTCTFDMSKAKKELEYQTIVPMSVGISKIIDEYKQKKVIFIMITTPRKEKTTKMIVTNKKISRY